MRSQLGAGGVRLLTLCDSSVPLTNLRGKHLFYWGTSGTQRQTLLQIKVNSGIRNDVNLRETSPRGLLRLPPMLALPGHGGAGQGQPIAIQQTSQHASLTLKKLLNNFYS